MNPNAFFSFFFFFKWSSLMFSLVRLITRGSNGRAFKNGFVFLTVNFELKWTGFFFSPIYW